MMPVLLPPVPPDACCAKCGVVPCCCPPPARVDTRRLLALYSALLQIRSPWDNLWREISDYVMPRRDPAQQAAIGPSLSKESRLFDNTAVHANMVLANGCLAWMSPMEGPWFSFLPPTGKATDDVKVWLAEATDEARAKLAVSNFYTGVHEFYLDRSAFGTAALYAEESMGGNGINVECWATGSFVIDEDAEGNVDTVARVRLFTARQALQKFTRAGLSPAVLAALDAEGDAGQQTFEYVHFILPRALEQRDPTAPLSKLSMPFASVYIEKATGFLASESGYPKLPVFVSRYLEWGSGMGRLYGWSPSFSALPEARQLNFLQRMMDALAEKMAFPPILAPEELEGEINPNAAGVTYFNSALAGNAMPKEWMTAGRYDVGVARVAERQAAINRAFHVDLFQMFSALEKQMTAREVAERTSEKLIQFSPTFARLVTELFNPFLACLFDIGIRQGWFGEEASIPKGLRVADMSGMDRVDLPGVQYGSRIAVALRSAPILALHRMIELVGILLPIVPNVGDNFDFDEAIRAVALLDSLPVGVLRSVDQVKKIRDLRDAAQAQAEKMQALTSAAEAAQKFGSVKPDSFVGQQMASAPPGSLLAA